jgi:MFS family permease
MSLLRTAGEFRRLWASRSVSLLGDSMSLVALLLYVAQNTQQAIAVALLLLVGDFAPALLAPLTGTVGDRFRARSVLVCCDVAQCVVVLVIALLLPALPVLLALVAIRALAGQIFSSASRAMLPSLVPDEKLEEANSTLGFGGNGMEVLGPFTAAALLPSVGIRGVLLVDAATFAVSAALLWGLPSGPRSPEAEPRGSFLHEARSGLQYLWAHPVLRVLTLGFLAVVSFNGVDDVALVFLVRDGLGGSASETALLYGAVGVGLLVGYAALVARGARLPSAPLLLLGFGISSLGNLLTGLAWAVPVAFALQAVRGLGLAAIDVGSNTLLQRTVPAHLLARTFGNLYGAIGVAAGLSYLLGVLLLELTSARTTFVIAGAGGIVATLITALALRRASPDPATPSSPNPTDR